MTDFEQEPAPQATPDYDDVPISTDELAALHNELVDELNDARANVAAFKDVKGGDEALESPNYNYALGKVIGFEDAVHAIHTFIEVKRSKLDELDSSEIPTQPQ